MGTPRPITAQAAVNGLGACTADVLRALDEGNSGLRRPEFRLPFETVVGAIPAPLPRLPEPLAYFECRQSQAALLAYREIQRSVEQAVGRWGAERVAILIGTSTGGLHATERAYACWRDSMDVPGDYDYQRQHDFNAVADCLATVSGIEGPAYTISTACSSSGKTHAAALRLIAADVVDAAVVGGIDTLCQMTLRGFRSLGVLSSHPCRPFGKDRDGINIGEGAAFQLIEREGDSDVWLLGAGESADAYHMSSPHPEGAGAVTAMQRGDAIRRPDAGGHRSRERSRNEHTAQRPGRVDRDSDAAGRPRPGDVDQGLHRPYPRRGRGHRSGVCRARNSLRAHPAYSGCAAGRPGRSVQHRLRTAGRPASACVIELVCVRWKQREPAVRPTAHGATFVIQVTGLGFWAPGVPDLRSYRAGALDPHLVEPPCQMPTSRAKRGTSRLARMLAEVFEQAVTDAETDPAQVGTVIASAWGEIDIMVNLLGQIYDEEPSLSPMRFKHSVHNAAGGLVSIAAQNRRFSTALAAGHRSVEAAFLEADTLLRTGECNEVVVALGEDRLPTPLDRFSGHDGLAVAFCLRAVEDGEKGATVLSHPARYTPVPPASPPTEPRYATNPIAWALPLLSAIEHGRGRVCLSGSPRPWTVEVSRVRTREER